MITSLAMLSGSAPQRPIAVAGETRPTFPKRAPPTVDPAHHMPIFQPDAGIY
jgi:hypothetical protein